MDKYAKLAKSLSRFAKPQNLPLVSAEVKAITGESCTVVVGGDLELTEVRIRATINGSSDKLLLVPKVGSRVLLGSLTGDLKDLCILKIDELAKVEYVQDGLKIGIDSTDKTVSLSNEGVSLKGLMQSLANILKNIKVNTPSGASTNILPDTFKAIIQFEKDFNKLLK